MSNDDAPARSTVYRSAVDLWVPVLILMTPAAAICFAVALIRQGRAGDALTLILIGTGLLIVTGMFTVPCRYSILNDALSIRCGILLYHVPFSEIKSVQPSASLRSGPALSLRRVRIETDRRDYFISPSDRDAFIADLNQAIQRC